MFYISKCGSFIIECGPIGGYAEPDQGFTVLVSYGYRTTGFGTQFLQYRLF